MITLISLCALAAPIDELIAWADRHPAPTHPPPQIEGYRFAGPHLGALAAEAARRPAAVQIESIGTTTWGHPVWAFHVTDPDVPVTEEILVFAGIHALEWISVEVAVQLLQELIERPPRGHRVTVIPLLNVDGRLKTEDDVAMGRFDVYRRGNGARPPVDLNRDFAVNREPTSVWRYILPGYHATTPTGALSQPETRALDALAARHDYARSVSLHAFGGYLYFPWAGRWARPDDWATFVTLGRAMERAQGALAYRPRQLSRWGFFFRAHGAEIDHLYGRYGTHAFLIELTRSGIRPWRLLSDTRTYLRWYNPVHPRPHVERGVAALRALIRTSSPD